MLKDLVITGAVIGILADAVKLTVNYLAFLLNFTDVVFWRLVATHFLEREDLFKPVALLIGGVADLVTTAVLGVVFVYFLHFTSSKFLWLKGIGFGLFVWVGLFGTFLGQVVQDNLQQDPAGILVTLVAHLFFGMALAFFTQLLAERNKDLLE